MKIWKRNAIIASVLLLVCAGVYLNWSKAQKSTAQDLTETLSAEQVMGVGRPMRYQVRSMAWTPMSRTGPPPASSLSVNQPLGVPLRRT